jgi:hypothetical protein
VGNITDEKTDLPKYRQRISARVEDIGPDAAQEVADRRQKKGKLSWEGHDIVSRQVKLGRKRNKYK